MVILRTALHLVLALVLAINGVAGVAMAAGMGSHAVAAAAGSSPASEAHGACHEAGLPPATDAPQAEAAEDCCAEGRCACACVHHGTVALAAAAPLTKPASWPALAAPDVAASPSAPVAPHLRPPIARVS